jgi:5-hydroxyisourate hydrolase-like protein (transthyretin family)
MTAITGRLTFVAALCILFCSCEKQDESRKETFPVTGIVSVDGSPVAELAVYCTNVAGMDTENPTTSSAFTDAEGKFEISTYKAADGVPAGDYVLTFKMGKMNVMARSYEGDKFKGRYADPKTSEVKFTVKDGEPNDLGTITLTTK